MRPSVLAKDKKIIPERIDLLRIDEFPRLTVQVRRDLISAARVIPNVIVTTATPSLHLAATRRELMSILEPEADRIARAEDRDILEILTEREQVAGNASEPNFRTVAGGVPSRRASASIAVSSGPSGATIPTRFRSASTSQSGSRRPTAMSNAAVPRANICQRRAPPISISAAIYCCRSRDAVPSRCETASAH